MGRLLCVMVAIACAGHAVAVQQSAPPDVFPLVKGSGYEGVIVPASSPWHQFYKVGLTVLDGKQYKTPDLAAWTPAAPDIALVERQISALVKMAAANPEKAAALVREPSRRSTASQLPWLVDHISTLKRTYYGITVNGERHVLLHAFVAINDRWRSEPITIMDGGCGNVWFDVSLTNGVKRFLCGSLAGPS